MEVTLHSLAAGTNAQQHIILFATACFLIGCIHGGMHGVWCLQKNIPYLTRLERWIVNSKGSPPKYSSKSEITIFFSSFFGLSSAGAVAAKHFGDDACLAWFFIGACIGFAPPLAVLIWKHIWIIILLGGLVILLMSL